MVRLDAKRWVEAEHRPGESGGRGGGGGGGGWWVVVVGGTGPFQLGASEKLLPSPGPWFVGLSNGAGFLRSPLKASFSAFVTWNIAALPGPRKAMKPHPRVMFKEVESISLEALKQSRASESGEWDGKNFISTSS